MFHLIYKVIRISRVRVGRRGRNIVNLLLKQTTLVYRREGSDQGGMCGNLEIFLENGKSSLSEKRRLENYRFSIPYLLYLGMHFCQQPHFYTAPRQIGHIST